MNLNTKTKLLVLSIAVLFLTGCLGGPSSGGGTATVQLSLTDTGQSLEAATLGSLRLDGAGSEEISEVWVTITAVHGHRDGGWVKLFDVPEPDPINLMGLRFSKELLGSGSIPAGKYDKVRFEVKENEGGTKWPNYIVINGEPHPLKVPPNKIQVDMDITITTDAMIELVFDVDRKFLVERGNDQGYIANPSKAMRYVKVHEDAYGTIKGEIELPHWVTNWLSIDVKLLRENLPVWQTSLENGMIRFELQSVPPGEYEFTADVIIGDLLNITLRSGTFTVEAGKLSTPRLAGQK
ncbi:MAG TPA: DUF4382 domain-containing protein [Limnochordia bacterium]|nr:DUF4382 domain-containing protein [Limnochordia bacterium]